MNLILQRPICFFDIESTGTNVETDRIVEISLFKRLPTGETEIKTLRLNPQVPIPKEASAIHGIGDADVASEPTFQQKAQEILQFIQGCDLGGFNCINYDIPLLYHEFERCYLTLPLNGVKFVDVMKIYHRNETRKLADAYEFYTGNPLSNAHGAEVDTKATIEVFEAQLAKYSHLPKTIDDLATYCLEGNSRVDISGKFIRDANGDIRFNFGKHKGSLAKDEISYLKYMLKANYSLNTKNTIQEILRANNALGRMTGAKISGQRFGNWLVTWKGIEWKGGQIKRYVIPKEDLLEIRDYGEGIYDWLVHIPKTKGFMRADTQGLNAAFLYAVDLYDLYYNAEHLQRTLEAQRVILETAIKTTSVSDPSKLVLPTKPFI